MSIWKSPIFYFGVLLIVLVSAALAAPFIVNWNNYRDNLELYGRKISGRDVAISGAISARLFPWPRLILEDVSIGNPVGFDAAPVLNAKSIEVKITLAGLFAGQIRVESVLLEAPTVNLTRLSDGRGNWVFIPDEVLRNSKLLEQVKLDQIKINNGVINFNEASRNVAVKLSDINATLAANALEGPWRLRGTAKQNDLPLDISINTSEKKDGEALQFNFKISPADGSYPALSFEGEQADQRVSGKLQLEPVETVDGKGSLNRYFDKLHLKADVTASFSELSFKNIHVVPADDKDSSTLIEGQAKVAYASGVQANIMLNSPRLDLDSLLGEGSMRVWRAGGFMAQVNGLLRDFPNKFDLSANLDVDSLNVAGQTIENVHLVASGEQNAIRVRDLTANLPGRSRMKFDGVVFPAENDAELGGNLAFESNDTRSFANWLWPEGKAQLNKVWSGTRGRLKLKSDVTWSGKRFGFQNLQYELDGELGSAELALRLGNLPAVDLKVNASKLDFDQYFGDKFQFEANTLLAIQGDPSFEKRLKFEAQNIRLNGVEANGVAIDFASSLSGFEVKKFDIASIEGAHLSGQGMVLQAADGPSGELKLNLMAENPRGVLKLIGALPKGNPPTWTEALGATNLQGSLKVIPGVEVPIVTFEVSGSSGSLTATAVGDLKDISNATVVGLSSEISATESSDLLLLLGVHTPRKTGKSGKLIVTATGTPEVGFRSDIKAELLNAKIEYEGNVSFGNAIPSLKGPFKLETLDASEIIAALGLPFSNGQNEPLKISANIQPIETGLTFENFTTDFGKDKISGMLQILNDGGLKADLALQNLDFKNLMTASLLPWQGSEPKFDSPFADFSKQAPKSEIWLRPEVLKMGEVSDLKEAVIGISLGADARNVSLASRSSDGEPFNLEMSMRPRGTRFELSATGRGSLDLARNFKTQDGQKIATGAIFLDGHFTGEGRSLESVFASMSGEGTYSFNKGQLASITPNGFYQKVTAIKDASSLQTAFDEVMQGTGTELSEEKLPLKLSDGVLTANPLVVTLDDAKITLQPQYDLTTGDFKADFEITAKNDSQLPAMRIIYAGEPDYLSRRSDTAALSAKLGYAIIARDIAELDRVQKEQENLVAAGEAQRIADEEKFAAFQAQRNELRLRQREMKIHAAQRQNDAAKFKNELEKAIIAGQAMKKFEIQKLLRLKQAP